MDTKDLHESLSGYLDRFEALAALAPKETH